MSMIAGGWATLKSFIKMGRLPPKGQNVRSVGGRATRPKTIIHCASSDHIPRESGVRGRKDCTSREARKTQWIPGKMEGI